MPRSSTKSSLGYTLLEILMVVAIVAIIAIAATPKYSSSNHRASLDAAGTELLNLIRHAQARSETEGVYTAIRIQENTSLDVFEVDDLVDPPEPTLTRVIHPLSKRPYSYTLSEMPATAGVLFDLGDGPFVHPDSSATEFLFFDPRGRPYVVSGNGIGRLAATNLSLSVGSVMRDLEIDNLSGRAYLLEP